MLNIYYFLSLFIKVIITLPYLVILFLNGFNRSNPFYTKEWQEISKEYEPIYALTLTFIIL